MNRIAVFSLHSSPLARIGSVDAGGMNVYVRRVADGLSRDGLKVDVFTRRTDSRAPEIMRTKDGTRIIHLDGGPPKPLPKSALPLHVPAFTQSFHAFVERERLRYDVIHAHYWLSGLAALRVRAEMDVPVVQMFHTLSRVKEVYGLGPDARDSALRRDAEEGIIGQADVVVGATSFERDIMQELYGVAPRTYAVIPPGVDLNVFRRHDKALCRGLLNLDADRVILFVGRPDRIKGLDIVLRSLAAVAPSYSGRLKLVVVGDPDAVPGRRHTPYERTVEKLGIEGMVEFRGIVPQEELALYYSAAHVCAVPSAYESFGMVAVESMACETPVIGFDIGGLAATVRDGETGFLARPHDRDEYARKLAEALRSTNLNDMGAKARLSVLQYEWSRAVQATMDLYESIPEEADLRPASGSY